MSILLSLRHPNVARASRGAAARTAASPGDESPVRGQVRVHEVVLDQQQMFLVMELVEYDLGHAASQEPWLRPSLSHPSLRLPQACSSST